MGGVQAMIRDRILAFAAAALLSACSNQPAEAAQERKSDPVTEVRDTDPEMNAAIAEAKRTLPEFLTVLGNPPAGVSEFSFKYPLGGVEHIWVDDVRHVGNRLTGRLANAPVQENYHQGQVVSVPLSEVSDWTYRDAAGVKQGNRTTRVLLPRLDPQEAASIRTYLGWKE
jgi:uncharacterized protein YegJ (DUF2314 family)